MILPGVYAEPFILDAVLAITALYRFQAESYNGAWVGRSGAVEYSLTKYNSAIRILRQHIAADERNLQIAVLGCLLFLSIEIFQGRDDSAVAHIRNGEALLKEIPSSTYIGSGSDGFDELVTTFARLSFHGLSFLGLVSTSHTPLCSVRPRFHSIPEAVLDLNAITKNIMLFLRRHGYDELKTLPERPPPDAILTGLVQFQALLRTWEQVFTSFISDEISSVDKDKSMVNMLRIHHHLLRIYISTHFFHDQLIFDQYYALFKDMVDMMVDVVEHGGIAHPVTRGPCFVPNITMIQPMFFVACKCRDAKLRRRAINLMKQISGGQGIYTGRTVSLVASWVMETEEGGSPDAFVREPKRLHDIKFEFDYDMTATIWARRRNGIGEWDNLVAQFSLT